jgi:hypothetical protein
MQSFFLVKQHWIAAIRTVEDTHRNLLARLMADEGLLLADLGRSRSIAAC